MSRRTLGSVVAVALALLAVAGSAYLLGRSAGPDEDDAAKARRWGAQAGYVDGLGAARKAGFARGRKTGTLEGLAAGRAAGSRAGAATAAREIERRAGVSAEVSAEAAASVAASEQAEAEALYYETHPWVEP